jgi:acyl dehydratase
MGFDLSVVGQPSKDFSYRYAWQDAARYALACGAGPDEPDLWLETQGPRVLPSFSVVWTMDAITDALGRLGGNYLTLVHGGHLLEVYRPLPEEAEVRTRVTITGVHDKSKGVLANFRAESRDDDGPLAVNEWRIFFRGEQSGGPPEPEPDPWEVAPAPENAVAEAIDEPTLETQALHYRLASNDLNPIHADAAVARAVGFSKPILHGLCTFGFAVRALSRTAAGGDPTRVRKVVARFANPVLPGDTLSSRIVRSGEEAWFETRIRRASPDAEPEAKPAIAAGRAQVVSE